MKGYLVNNVNDSLVDSDEFLMGDPDFMPGFNDELDLMDWCINRRTAKSGERKSKGEGKCFAGGAAAGGQMVDQRYLPKIERARPGS